jgi:general secretion pathway protein N
MAPHRAKRWAWMGAGTGLLAAMLVFAPARWLAVALNQLSGAKLQLVNTRGTAWNGQGDLLFSGGEGSRGQTALPQGIRWTLRPTWSKGPALRARLSSPCCTEQPLTLSVHPGLGNAEVRFDAFSSRWPAAMLVGLGTPWNTLRLDGQLQLQSPGFSVAWNRGRPKLVGQIVIEAHDLATRISTLRPLGSYRVDVTGMAEGDEARLALTTLNGGLQLQGDGQWVGGRLRFRGDARAAPGNETALANLLSIIGRRDGKRSVLTFG